MHRGQADGVFPVPHQPDQYPDLRDALDKLQLSDAALKYEPETSSAMGFGFRCGFLGLLHMEIVQELERIRPRSDRHRAIGDLQGEHDRWIRGDGGQPRHTSRSAKARIDRKPYVKMEIYAPNEYNGALMGLCQERRGEFIDMKYITTDRSR